MKELKQHQAKGYLTPEEKRLIRRKLKPYKKYLWRILALIILNILLVFLMYSGLSLSFRSLIDSEIGRYSLALILANNVAMYLLIMVIQRLRINK